MMLALVLFIRRLARWIMWAVWLDVSVTTACNFTLAAVTSSAMVHAASKHCRYSRSLASYAAVSKESTLPSTMRSIVNCMALA
eukprot:scaffold125753_cov53-Phaeocystis_antarctica.AAC.1